MGKWRVKWRVRRHAHRKAIIDAARLLGWIVVPSKEVRDMHGLDRNKYLYCLRPPAGDYLRSNMAGPGPDTGDFGKVKTFPLMWQAAAEACTVEGVDIDALKPPRETRASRCAKAALPSEGDRHDNSDERAYRIAALVGRDQRDR